MRTISLVHWIGLLGLACLYTVGAEAQPEIAERIVKVPVKVIDAYRKEIERAITVTVLELAGHEPYPLLVLNHGRATDVASRARLGRADAYFRIARWFASIGYSVWVPTRIGYGASGTDEDPEDTGGCGTKRYEPGYRVAADQALQVVEYAKQRPEIDRTRVIIVGHSFGGMTSIAMAARNTPGVLAAINFAGGGGGNPNSPRGEPCAPDRIERLFATYGETARMPTLWIYNENDRWFSPHHTRAWFEAYKSKGGFGDYLLLPPYREDGHNVFTENPALWQATVGRFLQEAERSAFK